MFLPLKNTYIKKSIEHIPAVTSAHRIAWSDHARGIAIMLVAYRHIVLGMQTSHIPVSNAMFNFQEGFYNFRMDVFFILSGLFVANNLKKQSTFQVFRNRVYTIFYPYVVWGLILISLEVYFSQYTNRKREWSELAKFLVQPRVADQLWYLYILFTCSVVYLLLRQLTKNIWIQAGFAVTIYVLNFLFLKVVYDYSLISDTANFYSYFFVGTCLPDILLNKERGPKVLNARNLLWLTPLFVAGQYFYLTHIDGPSSWERWFVVFFIINIVACFWVFIVMNRISQYRSTQWLSKVGRYSLYIYILHIPIIVFFRNIYLHSKIQLDSWLVLAGLWVAAVLVPIVLIKLGRPYGIEWLFSLKPKKDA